MTQNAINNSASSMDIDNINIDGNTISSTDTNGNVIIAPDGTGTLSVTTAPIVPSGDRADSLGSATNSWDNVYADGLTFDDGTNILATFEDNTTWTPVLNFGGATTGITYNIQNGTFSRIGNLVFVRFHINLSNSGSATGDATITGLPVTSASSITQGINCVVWGAITTDSTAFTSIGCTINSSTTILNLRQNPRDGSSGIALDDANFNTNSVIIGQGFYFV